LAAVLPNPWIPREGIDRSTYLETKFGSVEAYKGIAGRVVDAAEQEGLTYRPDSVKRQPNTIDCHRLIHWAEASGKSAEVKQRLMELYFRDGGDLTQSETLVQAAADVGLDADDIRKRLATDEDVELISGNAKEAADKGISGVPTFVFAGKYAVSGAQDAEKLARAIRQVSAEVNAEAAE
jgi:predicted DsbA family dithiol-disulfide isomerase